MKTKVNLTIEKSVLAKAKEYAADVNESLSGLVENYLKGLEKKKKESFLDFVDNLDVPNLRSEINYKEDYHKGKSKKYGF